MPSGTITAFDLTVGLQLDFEDMIYMLDPSDVPLLGGVTAGGSSLIGVHQCFETKVEWSDDTLLTPRSTITTTLAMGGTTLTFPSATDSLKYKIGDVLRAQNELVRITAINYTAGTATITRGFASTSDVAHTQPFVVLGVGAALPEGSDAGLGRAVDRTARSNFTQILQENQTMSGTEQVVRKYGVTNEWDYQAAKLLKQFAITMDQNLKYGLSSNDTTNKIRTAGGLIEFITSVVDSTAAAITNTRVENMLQTLWENGAPGTFVIDIGAEGSKDISDFSDGTIFVQRGDRGRGVMVDYMDTDFGRVSKLMDRNTRLEDAFVLPAGNVTREVLRPLFFKRLGDTGDSTKGMWIYEGSYRIRGNKHMGRFSALT